MSAFSSFHHQHTLPLDSVFLPNSNNTSCFSQFFQTETLENIEQSTKVSALSNNQTCVDLMSATNINRMDSSSTVTHNYNHRSSTPMRNKRKPTKVSANSAQSKDNSMVENKKQKKMKDDEEKKLKEEKKTIREELGPKGYIHVRARRGQATDNHSLAERVRREKISERMKLLQSIVPGCDKVTGKAQVLDQIISYVQSLQNQVEILSMKLASVNPISYDFAMELESFMVSPDQISSSLSSPLIMPAVQQRSLTNINDFLLLDDSLNSLMYPEHTQFPNALSEGNRVVCGEVDDQKQNIFNLSGFSDSLFHSI